MRELLASDYRNATPTMSMHKLGKGNFEKALLRVGIDNLLQELLFDDTTKQEAAMGIAMLKLPNVTIEMFKNAAPVGSRFWFFKHIDINESIKNHLDFVSEFSDCEWTTKTHNWNQWPLVPDNTEQNIIKQCTHLDTVADHYGAANWSPFNLRDYFEDEIEQSTNFTSRLWQK